VSDEADIDVTRYLIENFDRCMEQQYHSYAINRYLNDFKYQNKITAEEKEETHDLID
jgi:hypothetical protein